MGMVDRTLIGHVIDVRGNLFLSDLVDMEQATFPTVTIGDEDIAVGQLGSFVQIRQQDFTVVGMISRMTEREKLPAAAPGPEGGEFREPMAIRTIEIVPVGSLRSDGQFERGVPVYRQREPQCT